MVDLEILITDAIFVTNIDWRPVPSLRANAVNRSIAGYYDSTERPTHIRPFSVTSVSLSPLCMR